MSVFKSIIQGEVTGCEFAFQVSQCAQQFICIFGAEYFYAFQALHVGRRGLQVVDEQLAVQYDGLAGHEGHDFFIHRDI